LGDGYVWLWRGVRRGSGRCGHRGAVFGWREFRFPADLGGEDYTSLILINWNSFRGA
jgi:hypothetical protein